MYDFSCTDPKGMKPVTDEMRVDFPHILKNGLLFLQIWTPQSLPLLRRSQAD